MDLGKTSDFLNQNGKNKKFVDEIQVEQTAETRSKRVCVKKILIREMQQLKKSMKLLSYKQQRFEFTGHLLEANLFEYAFNNKFPEKLLETFSTYSVILTEQNVKSTTEGNILKV